MSRLISTAFPIMPCSVKTLDAVKLYSFGLLFTYQHFRRRHFKMVSLFQLVNCPLMRTIFLHPIKFTNTVFKSNIHAQGGKKCKDGFKMKKKWEGSLFSQSNRQQQDHFLYRCIEPVVIHSSYTAGGNGKEETFHINNNAERNFTLYKRKSLRFSYKAVCYVEQTV